MQKVGEKMETCLQPLWELLREPMFRIVETNNESGSISLAEKQRAAANSKRTIDLFFAHLKDRIGEKHQKNLKPKHIGIFENALENFADKSVAGVREGAKKAKASSYNCHLCAVCRNCAANFYDSIQTRRIVEKKLPYELKKYFTEFPQMYYYQLRMDEDNERKNLQDSFLLLKGFSSSTPTIYSATFNAECFGGGLYINYNGTGIVIDPGIGFVNSMHKHGIYIRDIHFVIVTHDHYDHNADAEAISSLLYDYNSYNKRRCRILKDVFKLDNVKAHEIQWIVDTSTANKLNGKIAPVKELKTYADENEKEISKDVQGIRLSALKTNHIKNGESYSLIMRLLYGNKWFEIGYTSDTPYFPKLPAFFHKTDLLVFHVSDLYRKDVKGIKDKSNHLGYNGSIKLLKDVNAKLVIASEFCCTNGDFRMDFMKSIVNEIIKDKDISFLPGEIGLKICMPKSEIECSLCKRRTTVKEIKVISPTIPFGKIVYACRQCAQSVL